MAVPEGWGARAWGSWYRQGAFKGDSKLPMGGLVETPAAGFSDHRPANQQGSWLELIT